MRYATIGILLLAWVLLACDEKEEVSGPSVPFPDYGAVSYTHLTLPTN